MHGTETTAAATRLPEVPGRIDPGHAANERVSGGTSDGGWIWTITPLLAFSFGALAIAALALAFACGRHWPLRPSGGESIGPLFEVLPTAKPVPYESLEVDPGSQETTEPITR